MAHHPTSDLSSELTQLRPAGKALGPVLMAGGLAAVVLAYFLAGPSEDGHNRRFWFAYLFGVAGAAAVSFAALIFTLVNHLVRAGWITNVRRLLETFAVQTGLVLVLMLPVLGVTLLRDGKIYAWAKPADTPKVSHHDGHGEGHGEGHEGHAAGTHVSTDAGHEGHVHDAHGNEAAATRPATAPAGPGPASDGINGMSSQAYLAGAIASVDDAAPAAAPTHGPDAHAGGPAETKQAEHNEPQVKEGALVSYPNEQVRPGVQRDFDENIARKNAFWLNPFVWTPRVLFYLATLFGIAYWYWSSSVKQDENGDIDISARLSYLAGPMTIASGLIISFFAFDVYMSLDPHWFSTMYGIYFFASGTQAMWAIMALFVLVLQWRGYLRSSITTEHRHDIGKFLWAFIFFWGYVAFSQYMLQWYANLPEETFWYDKRGYSQGHPNGYTALVVALLVGRFCVPFLFFVSRHVKRSRVGLGFFAVWLLLFFVLDMYLLVIPEYKWVERHHLTPIGPTEVLAFGGVAALWLGNTVRVLGNHALRPVRDPRVHESATLVNF